MLLTTKVIPWQGTMAGQFLPTLASAYFEAYFVPVLLFTILQSNDLFFLFSECVISKIVPYYWFFLLSKKFFMKIFAFQYYSIAFRYWLKCNCELYWALSLNQYNYSVLGHFMSNIKLRILFLQHLFPFKLSFYSFIFYIFVLSVSNLFFSFTLLPHIATIILSSFSYSINIMNMFLKELNSVIQEIIPFLN